MKNWTVRILIFTFVCFGLAALFAKIVGEDKLISYWQSVIPTLSNNNDFVSKYMEESFLADKLNEINIADENIEIKIEKSKDNRIHFNYYKKWDQAKSDLTSISGSVFKFHLDKLIYPSNAFKFNLNFKTLNALGITVRDAKEVKVLISIPINIQKIKIETISGDIKVIDIKLNEIQVDAVSGDFEVEKSDVKQIQHTSVSGNVILQGDIQSMKSETISGYLTFKTDRASPDIKYSTVSGGAIISFTKDPDVSIKYESVSGGDIQLVNVVPTANTVDDDAKVYKFGNGKGQLHFSSTSSGVKILKIKQ